MKKLLLFNPENDIALGMGLARFTPPRQAALLHRAGAMLAAWLGDEQDYVYVESADLELARGWHRDMAVRLGLHLPEPIDSIEGAVIEAVEPFGWSLDTIAQFERIGVSEQLLQNKCTEMDRHRKLSHRRSALNLLEQLSIQGYTIQQQLPIEAKLLAEVEVAVGEFGEAYVKSPWSSSGRGVFPITGATLAVSADRIQGIIKRQGSVMVEPAMPKLQDFAMLFDCGEFVGYSLFYNSTATNYGGNFVASDDRILEKLSQWIPVADVEDLRREITKGLAAVLGDEFYNDKLGVDMMVCGNPGGAAWIAPCVEINLRATMGFVARGVYRKIGREGVMTITPKIAGQSRPEGINLIPENQWFSAQFCEQA